MTIIKCLCATILLLFVTTPALAQKPCTRIIPFEHVAPTGPVEIVPGLSGQRVYFCGFMVTQKGNTLDLKIWAGEGPTCTGVQEVLSPQWSFPNDFAIVNRLEMVGPYSDLDHSLCIQTFGTGALTGAIYWEQF